jgi:hypothetical protein
MATAHPLEIDDPDITPWRWPRARSVGSITGLPTALLFDRSGQEVRRPIGLAEPDVPANVSGVRHLPQLRDGTRAWLGA